ncbi:MAG: imidazoleglycerol-phosphate dehydratase HisB [Myxococcales bacterium]|jgi:imidazoleglycerol phosphate dehydratase HisB|nr:imidazoleglycerol-phosphate dehydratase HisB [Myxococcales bacterium]
MSATTQRTATIQRKTLETDIVLSLNLDGSGRADVQTGLGFFDHMLTALARHSGMDLTLKCQGDLHIDDHHTVEDSAICLGQALTEALGDKRGIVRFGYAYAPLDEALARAVVDLSGRPTAVVNLDLQAPRIGSTASENLVHAIESLAATARITVHVDVLRGANDHHRAEAAYKALALALKAAIRRTDNDEVPSTKGLL